MKMSWVYEAVSHAVIVVPVLLLIVLYEIFAGIMGSCSRGIDSLAGGRESLVENRKSDN